ncbi:hypothetical protein IQ249_15140 [Lusitaniella coriacea LEGE 07157]|uniref:Uncharacterized protein n=1 Tax=Lusitaniella coriacea LEGE 07157 TaxID=945747 RepID=A0A8J7DXL6_9CYAN|nr:hypothetical protein [Lusitaniella coriacea]MBE9117234.1 hypothetical protein [Lusitaniella coriacea LEGE 07157]
MVCDILQVIALGSIVTFLVAKYLKPQPWVYGLLANGVYLLFLGVKALSLTVPFPLSPWLLSSVGQYNPFPLLPWLSVFFLGAFAYNVRQQAFWWAMAYGGLLLSQIPWFFSSGFWAKIPMGGGYFFLGCALSLGVLSLLCRTRRVWNASHPLVYLGQRSLLFLFVLALVGKGLKVLGVVSGFAPPGNGLSGVSIWLVAFALSFWGMKGIERINSWYFERVFERVWVWGVLLLAIVLFPFAAPRVPLFVQLGECLLGIAFACNYRQLTRWIKGRAMGEGRELARERESVLRSGKVR